MTDKYNFVTNPVFKIRSLLLLLIFIFPGISSFAFASNSSQEPQKVTAVSKSAADIVNPGLDPVITLSSNTATLFAAANSTAEVNVTSNIAWTVSSNQTWLAVSPASGSMNGTLTFTADANTGLARNATVTVSAIGVADQTIQITQLAEDPSLTFRSSSSGNLSVFLQFNSNGSFYIDWGDGTQLLKSSLLIGDTYSTGSYIAGNTVKIYGTGITNITAGSKGLVFLDVSQCVDLTYLSVPHNTLSVLDVTKNTKLTFLDVAYNSLAALDVSSNTLLNNLTLSYNNLSTLDVSKNTVLTTLSCISNKINSLDLSKNTILSTLYCYSNRLSTLDVSNNPALLLLYCYSNNLDFVTLPQPKSAYTAYNYAPQARFPASVYGNNVDLSSQLTVKDVNNTLQTTVYKWYTKTTGTLLTSGTDYTEASGVFTFLKNPSDSLYCTMTNAALPGFTGANVLRTVNLKVQLVIPVLTTQAETNIGSTMATGNGTLTDTGIPNPTAHGFCWNTTGMPTTLDSKNDLGPTSATVPFALDMSVLLPATTYYIRAYATNLAGTGYGNEITFTTTGLLSSITTNPVTNITITKATLNGSIVDLGAPNPTQFGFVWDTSSAPTIALPTKTTKGPIAVTGPFASNISGLTANTLYYVRAYATNTVGTAYGMENVFFTTLTPTINAPNPLALSGFSTTVGTASVSQTFTIGGTLSAPLVVTAPAGYEVRESGIGIFGATVQFGPVSEVVTDKTIEVRIAATAPLGAVAGNVVCSSIGATSQNVPVDGNVLPIQLTITSPTVPPTRAYDGTPVSYITPGILSGVLPGDVANVTLTTTAFYDNANAGIGKTVTISYSLSGTAAYKYLAPLGSTTTADITPAAVTVTAVTDTKTYDASVSSSGVPVVGLLASGDAVNITPIQVFDSPNAGTTHVLIPSGLTIKNASNGDATANYTITYANSPATGVISQLAVSVTAVTDTKIYNGNTGSAGNPVIGALLPVDAVNTFPTQVFDSPGIGTTHVLIPSGLTIKDGSNADVTANYLISYVNSPATGVIDKLVVMVTAVTDTKTYDATVGSAALPLVGMLAASDAVNTNPIQVFDNPSSGTTHILTASGLTIKDGSNVDVTGNYTINYVSSPATGVINKRTVNVTAIASTKTYDATVNSIDAPQVGLLAAGDVVNVAPVQVFDTPAVGTLHVLTASGLTIKDAGNADATGNYTINYVNSPATGVINKLTVTVTAVTDTKTYDGTISSIGVPLVGLFAAGDVVNTPAVQVFDNSSIGLTHVLTASGLTIKDGSNADVTGNYTINYISSPANGVIGKLAVQVTAVTDTKTFDKTTFSGLVPVVGLLAPGDLINTNPIQVFDSPVIGTTHVLIPSGLTIKDASNVDVTANYTINYVNSPATGEIDKLVVTVTAVPDTKTYDATAGSLAHPLVGSLLIGDVINIAPIQVFDNPYVGNTHVLTPSGLTIKDGSNADVTANYTINYVSSAATGIINKLTVNVTAVASTKTYDATVNSSGAPVVGLFAAGDVVNVAPVQVFDSPAVGTFHVLTPLGLTIKDGSNVDVTANYTINYVNSPATGVINKLTVTVTAVTDTKNYDGTNSSIGIPLVGLFAPGDVVNTPAVQEFDNASIGLTHVLTASGLTIKDGSNADVTGNYTINYISSPANGVIDKLTVQVTAISDAKPFDKTTSSIGIPQVGQLALGDVINTFPIQVFDTPSVGTTHVLIPSGLTIKNGSNVDVTANYTINYVNSAATGLITKLDVSVTAVTDTKIYNGNTVSAGSPVVGALLAGDVVNVHPIQVFDTPDAGNTHVLIPSGLTIKDGSNADVTGNYAITYINSPATGIISQLGVTVTAVTDTRTYDATQGSTGHPVVGILLAGDVVSNAPIQIFETPSVGTTHILVPFGLTIKNASNVDVTANYLINYVNSPATGVINPMGLTVTAVTDARVYDATVGSVGNPVVGILASGDLVNVLPIQVFDNSAVGTTHILIPSGLTIKDMMNADVTGNYAINYVNSPATGVISKRDVTVTAVLDTKPFDTTVSSAGIPLVGILAAGDVVNLAPTQLFDTPTIGTTHVLTASGLTIKNGSNTDVTGNYAISYVDSPPMGVITKLDVTVTAVTDTKPYDGNTSSTGSPVVGALLAGNVVNVHPIQVFDTRDAGTTHVLIPSGLTIKDGSNADVTNNYNITYVNSPATGIIQQLGVTVTAVTDTKTYNATVGSAGIPVVGSLLLGDAVKTIPTQVFDAPGAGTTHVLIPSGLTIKDGSNADVTANYAINYVNSPATGVINKLALAVTAVSDTKTYDATVNSTIVPSVGILATGDVVNTAPVQVFDTPAVGTAHVLTPSGLTIYDSSNADATGNYAITYVNSPANGVINKLVVDVTALTDTKTYDATVTSAALPLVGMLATGETVNAIPTQVYDTPDAGTTHVLIPSGLTIKNGSNADMTGNYTINYVNSPATGVINPFNVSVTAVTDTKTYNGNTVSAGVPLVGTLLAMDHVNTMPTQVFDNPDAGTKHELIPSGLTIKDGSNADVTANYAISYVNSPATGVIQKFDVTVTAVTDTKTYDGNTGSVGSPLVGLLLAGDVVNTLPKQVFDTPAAGSFHELIPSGLTILNGSNADVTANYAINYVNSPATGVINKLALAVTAVTDTKIYDATVNSAIVPTVGILATGDAVNTAPVQVFDTPVVGTAHVLTPSGLTIHDSSNVDATGNYAITYINSPANGVINKLVVDVTAVPDTKTYDATLTSSAHPLVGILATGEVVNAIPMQAYDTPDAGTTHVLTPSGLTIKNGSNTDMTGNYTINYVNSPATGVINPFNVSVTAVTDTKTYNGNTGSAGVPLVGALLAVDHVNTIPIQVFDTPDAGTTHILIPSGLTIQDGSNTDVTANYFISYVNSPATGVIQKFGVTVTAVTDTKIYDGTTGSVGVPVVGALLAGEVVNTYPIQVFDTPVVGTTHLLIVSGLTIKNSSNADVTGNYAINYVNSPTGVITKLDLTVTALTDSKIYDATVGSVVTPLVGALATGDVVNAAPVQVFDTPLAGTAHVLTPSGLTIKDGSNVDATGNYRISYLSSPATGVITSRLLTISDPTITTHKVLDGNTTVQVTPGVISGIASADVGNVTLTAVANYDNPNLGTDKTITVVYGLTGSAAGNYTAPANYVITTGIIGPMILTITDPSINTVKEYDGTTSVIYTPGVLSGLDPADAPNVILTSMAAYDNANAGTGKTITVTYGLSGSLAGNYVVPAAYTITTGVITPKPLVVVSLKITTSKVYDTTASATFTVGDLTGVVLKDVGNVILAGTAIYDNANAGTGKNITVSYTLSGSAIGNYTVPSSYTITNGVIKAKQLTIANPVVVTNKMVDGNTTAAITTLGNLQGVEALDGSSVNFTAAANYDTPNIGINKTITVGYTLNGTAMGNYIAPVDFIITGAKISDVVTLSPLITPTNGCEGSSIDQAYSLLTGTPTQYQITFDAATLAAGIQNVSYTNLPSSSESGILSINIPTGTKDGIYQGALQFRNELGVESPVYTFQFTINVSADYIIPKFDDVVLIDNSSNRFVAYQWYKDGVELQGATKQFYNDLGGLVGSYSARLTTTDGQTLYTCSKVLETPLSKKVTVFPSPVKKSQVLTIKVTGLKDEELAGSELSVYTMQGTCVYHTTEVQKVNTISLPPVVGMYIGHVTTSGGQKLPFKVIVIE